MMDYGLEEQVDISFKNKKIDEINKITEQPQEQPQEIKKPKRKILSFPFLVCLSSLIVGVLFINSSVKSSRNERNNRLFDANKALIYETLKLAENDNIDNLQRNFYDYSMKKNIDVKLKLSSNNLLGIEFNDSYDKENINVLIEFNKLTYIGKYLYTLKYYNLSEDMANKIDKEIKNSNYPGYSINTFLTKSENERVKDLYNITIYAKKIIEKSSSDIINDKLKDLDRLISQSKENNIQNSVDVLPPQIPPPGLPPLQIPSSVAYPTIRNNSNNLQSLPIQPMQMIDKNGTIYYSSNMGNRKEIEKKK